MRQHVRALVPMILLVSLASGCGRASESAPAKSAPGGYRTRAMGRQIGQPSVDSDGDGIMDAKDKMEEPAEAEALDVDGPMDDRGRFEPTSQTVGGNMAAAPAPAPPPPGQPALPLKPKVTSITTPPPAKPASPTTKHEQHQAQMLVYTGKLSLAVYQVESQLEAVERIAKEHDGYLARRADRQIVIRVPREKFEVALDAITKLGDVIHRDISADDVTDQFVDLSARLKNAKSMQARLRQLLERAAVKEAIAIEKELGRITEEIERIEGKLKLLKDRVAFSTIEVTFQARGASLNTRRVVLPFPWLRGLGLPRLLSLHEEKE